MREFQFLYERRPLGPFDEIRIRTVHARTVDAAARRMAAFMEYLDRRFNWINSRVDYDVQEGNNYIDLYKLGERHPIARFLP